MLGSISVQVNDKRFHRRFREDAGSLVTISMIDLPKQRHRRTVAKSNFDLMSKRLS